MNSADVQDAPADFATGLVFSTSWNAHRHKEARRMIFEIRELGFDTIELSFNLTKSMVHAIAKLVKKKEIRVASVHNYAPIPDRIPRALALPDCLSLSSSDENERRKAVRYARRTIDTAHEMHARYVVLHCGRVPIADRTRELCLLLEKDGVASAEFHEIKERVTKERKAKAARFLNTVLRSLDEIQRYARQSSVALGIETRFYQREIPSYDELGTILEAFKGGDVYYWHDTGHAQVMEHLGFHKHIDFLKTYQHALAGVHLHDISGCKDHQAPLQGEFDFSIVKPFLRKSTCKVLEVHRPANGKDIKKAVTHLKQVFDGVI